MAAQLNQEENQKNLVLLKCMGIFLLTSLSWDLMQRCYYRRGEEVKNDRKNVNV